MPAPNRTSRRTRPRLTEVGATPKRFYDGRPGRELVKCPDCTELADASLGGDHGGQCLGHLHSAPRHSALGVVRAYAKRHARFSANDLRAEWDTAGVKKTSRGPAMAVAKSKGWVEEDGSIPSTDRATKGHRVAVYQSLIFERTES